VPPVRHELLLHPMAVFPNFQRSRRVQRLGFVDDQVLRKCGTNDECVSWLESWHPSQCLLSKLSRQARLHLSTAEDRQFVRGSSVLVIALSAAHHRFTFSSTDLPRIPLPGDDDQEWR